MQWVDWLEQIKEENNLTLKTLATTLKVSEQAIHCWIYRESQPAEYVQELIKERYYEHSNNFKMSDDKMIIVYKDKYEYICLEKVKDVIKNVESKF